MALVESTKEAKKSGFQGIKKVRGLLLDIVEAEAPASWESKDKQVFVTMEDTTVLEMMSKEDEPMELKEGKYNFYIKYSLEKNSAYMKAWVASAEKLGFKPSDKKGQYVTLEKIPVVLFKKPIIDEETKKPKLDAEGKKVLEEISTTNTFSFVADETSGTTNVNDYIRDLLVGKNTKAALRSLVSDTRAKQFPAYKAALQDGTIAAQVGLTIVDGIFQKTS